VALVGVNQNSFEHLACLLEALGAQGQAQGAQNGAKGPVNGIGEARYLCPGKKAYLAIYLAIYLSVYLSMYLSTYLSECTKTS